MRIGIDFDNTIITYDEVFRAAARAQGLIESGFDGSKQAVRDAIRLLPDGELTWQKLQGQVYGKGIIDAGLCNGVDSFLRRCRAEGAVVFIVSHKTEFGHYDPARVNLRTAALDWMTARGFFRPDGYGLAPDNVFFEGTRAEKLARIGTLDCSYFIDDLEEVLDDPGFPAGVQRILFSDLQAAASAGPYIVCPGWRDIEAHIFGGADRGAQDEAHDVATTLLGGTVAVHHLAAAGGRNSRIYRIDCGGRRFALKQYPSRRDDARDRLGTEVGALSLMERCNVADVPRVVGLDRPRGYALLTWVDGAAVADISDADIDAAIAFLGAVHALRRVPAAAEQPAAAEACLSGNEIARQIEARLILFRSLQEEKQLIEFLDEAVAPQFARRLAEARTLLAVASLDFAAELPQEWQSLVPSDFGFHNSLRRGDGSLAFVDFEYFGWDDPVKLTADILLHPGRPLAPSQRRRFRQAAVRLYGEDRTFERRLAAYLPLFGLRWVLILLNEFIPERWQRRVLAGDTTSWNDAKARQLDHARAFLAALPQKVED
jgi:hypothetical protein